MTDTINTYTAILLITVAGSGAALLIVDVATDNVLAATVAGNQAQYLSLQQSLLNNRK